MQPPNRKDTSVTGHWYAGADLVRRHADALDPAALPRIGRLVTATPWWDTADELAVAAGRIVRRHPRSRAVMDEWLESDDLWRVRVAILHQERWRDDTDADWLFAACRRHAADRDFFIRKAIGWALRSYAKCRPEAVAEFLRTDGEALSGLSRREAERGVAFGRDRPPAPAARGVAFGRDRPPAPAARGVAFGRDRPPAPAARRRSSKLDD